MIEQYKKSQPAFYHTLKSVVLKKNNNHAFLLNMNHTSCTKDILWTLAKTFLCPNQGDCGHCDICKRIESNQYPEFIIIEPDGQTIKKEQMNMLKNKFSTKMLEGNVRIYAILDVDKFNESSANSILKFLEEPEEHIYAILTTQFLNKIMETIKSRCQIIHFRPDHFVNPALSMIKKIQMEVLDERDKNSMMDENELLNKVSILFDLIIQLEKSKKNVFVRSKQYWHQYFSDRNSMAMALNIIIYIYRDILEFKLSGNITIFDAYVDTIKKIALSLERDEIIRKIDTTVIMKEQVYANVNQLLFFDKLVLELGSDYK